MSRHPYRLTFPDEGVLWGGGIRKGLPILRLPSGAVCQETLMFLATLQKSKEFL
jgi:hypothetical protein